MLYAPCKFHAHPLQGPPLPAAAVPRARGRGTLCYYRRSIKLQAGPQELLEELQAMDDEALQHWAAANRAALTLDLLAHIALVQSRAEAGDRERLWALGSKLMAVREGLVPVANEVLQQELRAAASQARLEPGGGSSSNTNSLAGNGAQNGAGEAPTDHGPAGDSSSGSAGCIGAQGGALQAAQRVPPPKQRPTEALSFVAQRTAQLGLSPEGLALLQQQAAALEAVVGTSKAQSLTEVIGRKELSPQEQLLLEADAATRILQLLISIPDRQERAALLPDAFTPAEASDPAAMPPPGACAAFESEEEEEELLSTTPMALLQAVDLQLSRLLRPAQRTGAVAGLLAGGGELGDLAPEELLARLQQLREDTVAFWGELGNTSGEEF